MVNGIRTGDSRGFNKGRSSKFRVGSRVRQTAEEGRRTYRPKRWGNNNKDEDNSPKTFDDENHQASSQKFRQLIKEIKKINLLSSFVFFTRIKQCISNWQSRSVTQISLESIFKVSFKYLYMHLFVFFMSFWASSFFTIISHQPKRKKKKKKGRKRICA